ncbi:hypothetical protein BO94DRAFT_482702 [Aspergillus sclerotioniger CBS 115572]|uniref:tRNA wybutosine-synthesizing protein 2 n=1 Tax=Aspergillus sclerotioniger CBS 115572 TaxID=1450535 RepID=A0A317XBE1_9EURO|nr:hypothetical protein BO94DRAFT_482702 [Aspergillus sclerotioniger CBS 115572]PWY95829.1 hypothetical protein BO94DRAFT_482702 [Aspergillus sclerotioniger CBS 115572]
MSDNIPQSTTTTTASRPHRTPRGKGNNGTKNTNRAPKLLNPLQKGIQEYLTHHLPQATLTKYNLETLLSSLPKRFTVYEPLLLLPVNALSSPPSWSALYTDLTPAQRETLFACIVQAFSRSGVTHVAINAPIALTGAQGQENRMRSPAGLVPLYGDFGPMVSDNGMGEQQPTEEDLGRAFWVRTMQNHGIVQIWAPLYTMFSRGNVTEKARILGAGSGFEGLDDTAGMSVVDMYAGIGYFVFSYLKRGVRRVWGWEINGWSVEGLRRGCEANGWGCRVIRVGGDGSLEDGLGVEEMVDGLRGEDRVVVFHGDNRFAADVLGQAREAMEARGEWCPVKHVNLGLLPSSAPAWENACRMVDAQKGGWLHVHENVDVQRIEEMKDEITAEVGKLRARVLEIEATVADCRHVEQVKTYAPGVMHCVFDVMVPSLDEV